MSEAIAQAKFLYPKANLVISLGTLREHYLKTKRHIVNSMIKEIYGRDAKIQLSHHEHIQINGRAKPGLLETDGYHLTENGTKLLVSNLQHAVEPWRSNFQTKSYKQTNQNKNNQLSPPNRYNLEIPLIDFRFPAKQDRDERTLNHTNNYIMTRV